MVYKIKKVLSNHAQQVFVHVMLSQNKLYNILLFFEAMPKIIFLPGTPHHRYAMELVSTKHIVLRQVDCANESLILIEYVLP